MNVVQYMCSQLRVLIGTIVATTVIVVATPAPVHAEVTYRLGLELSLGGTIIVANDSGYTAVGDASEQASSPERAAAEARSGDMGETSLGFGLRGSAEYERWRLEAAAEMTSTMLLGDGPNLELLAGYALLPEFAGGQLVSLLGGGRGTMVVGSGDFRTTRKGPLVTTGIAYEQVNSGPFFLRAALMYRAMWTRDHAYEDLVDYTHRYRLNQPGFSHELAVHGMVGIAL